MPKNAMKYSANLTGRYFVCGVIDDAGPGEFDGYLVMTADQNARQILNVMGRDGIKTCDLDPETKKYLQKNAATIKLEQKQIQQIHLSLGKYLDAVGANSIPNDGVGSVAISTKSGLSQPTGQVSEIIKAFAEAAAETATDGAQEDVAQEDGIDRDQNTESLAPATVQYYEERIAELFAHNNSQLEENRQQRREIQAFKLAQGFLRQQNTDAGDPASLAS